MVGRIELVAPEQRILLKKIANRAVADMDVDQKKLQEICYGGLIGDRDGSQSKKVWEGRAPLASLGKEIPATYQAYIDLGRFRNALIIDEIQRRPSEELKHFVQINRLDAYRVPDNELRSQ